MIPTYGPLNSNLGKSLHFHPVPADFFVDGDRAGNLDQVKGEIRVFLDDNLIQFTIGDNVAFAVLLRDFLGALAAE